MDEAVAAAAGAGGGKQPMTQEEQAQQQEQQRQMEDQRDATLRAILDADSRERLKRIAVVKPDKARNIENYVIQSVRQGRLAPPVTDSKLKQLLEAMNDQVCSGLRIVYQCQ